MQYVKILTRAKLEPLQESGGLALLLIWHLTVVFLGHHVLRSCTEHSTARNAGPILTVTYSK